MKIIKSEWGVASRIGETIYINKRITGRLYNQLIKHEKKHTSNYSIKDIMLDINNKELKGVKKEYWKFILTNPSSWTLFLPLTYSNKKMYIDPIMCFIWLLCLFAISYLFLF